MSSPAARPEGDPVIRDGALWISFPPAERGGSDKCGF
jgi:hypothetical protein